MLIRRDRALATVSVMLDVAFRAGRTATVNAADIAERLGLARRGMEPMLQSLSRAGLLESVRGPRGGYRLGRPARDIRIADIVATVTAADEAPADGPKGGLHEAVVDPLWAELDAGVMANLQTLTLNDLIRRAEAKGLRRPASEPISFVI